MCLRLLSKSSIAAAVALLLMASPAWSAPPKESWTGSTSDAPKEDVVTEASERSEAVKDLETVDPDETTASGGQSRVDPSRDAADRCLVRVVAAVLHVDGIGKDAELVVDSKDGVIVLEGELPTQEAVDHMQQLLAGVEGVNSVDTSALTVAGR